MEWSRWARMLPYLEADSLYRTANIPNGNMALSLKTGAVMTNPDDTTVMATPLKLLSCPTDSSPRVRNDMFKLNPVAVTNYVGVGGSNWGDCYEYRSPGPAAASYLCPFNSNGYNHTGANGNQNGLDNGDGMFFRCDYMRSLKLQGVKDGLSRTLMVGETLPDRTVWASWAYGNHGMTCAIPPNAVYDGKTWGSMAQMSSQYDDRTKPETAGQPYNRENFMNNWGAHSYHRGGAQFVYADGHVGFIANQISMPTYWALGTINGKDAAADLD
jgi:prepilin-type processing-associated H-X9-DG protein